MAVSRNVANSILSLKTQIGTMNNGKPRYERYYCQECLSDKLGSCFRKDRARLYSLNC